MTIKEGKGWADIILVTQGSVLKENFNAERLPEKNKFFFSFKKKTKNNNFFV